MVRRIRITALALAFSVFTAQAAQAEIRITPLDVPGVSQEEAVSGREGTISGQEGAGPGGQAAQTQPQAVVSMGNYSTKEPVYLQGNNVPGDNMGSSMIAGETENGTARLPGTESSEIEIKAPEISAQAGILYDATHDRVLFEKSADSKFYPASITKLMTGLLVLENARLTDTVTFSKTAVTNLESGAVTLKLAEGDKVSVRDCLYGLMLKSANEVANGLAEHVGGSISGFAQMMNRRAKDLGCTNTNFVNPNGLNDPNHYTTARDMAKIANAAFANEELCRITSTLSYTFPATKNAAARTIIPGHKMIDSSDSRYYPGIVGGKTGYTSLAGNTLVTCVEKDGTRMIAVVLKAKSTHYTDTKAMLDYGYALLEAESKAGTNAAGNGQNAAVSFHKWIQDGGIWYFDLADGTRIKDQCITVDGVDYVFDRSGRMLTGWQYLNNTWYYFMESGAMVKNSWQQDQGKWIYLGGDGRMVTNAMIDGIYYVGADGLWVENAVAQESAATQESPAAQEAEVTQGIAPV